jgi:hypothetical protein
VCESFPEVTPVLVEILPLLSQNGSLVVYVVDEQRGERIQRYPEISHVASLDDVGRYLGSIINSEWTEELEPNSWE